MTAIDTRPDAGEVARDVLELVASEFARPEVRAGIAATMLTTVVMARLGCRFGMTVFVATLAGSAVEGGYAMLADIADGARRDD